MKSAPRCLASLVLLFLASVLSSHPSAYGEKNELSATVLRGCLRTIGDRAYLLIGDDNIGYVLTGDRKVFSRHTDQEVMVAGTTDERSPDHGPASSPLQTQILLQPSNKKRHQDVSEIPGFVTIHVSSLTPLVEECPQQSPLRAR